MTTTLPIPEEAPSSPGPPRQPRTLAYNFLGSNNPSALTIFYFHGYPVSHAEAALFYPFALQQGVRILAITRQGYGGSTYIPDRTLLDWPQDVLALADHLGIDRFGVIGVSGGGAYVLACLHSIPKERLLAAGIVCGLYPPDLGFAQMGLKQRFLLNAGVWAPGLLTWVMRGQFEKICAKGRESGTAIEEFLDAEMKNLAAVDHEVWERNEAGFRDAMVASCRLMMGNEFAVDAIAREARLFGSPWGFEIGELAVGGSMVVRAASEVIETVLSIMRERRRQT